jgi:FlaA1/EpsC-like NDP-sugar epimerase
VLTDKRVVITGATGSLGKVLIRRLLSGEMGKPRKIVAFSRDEAKQHFLRVEYMKLRAATDEVIYRDFENILDFRIGDVRDFHAVAAVLREADVVFNAAALKQVPTCEYFPIEAVQTNIAGPENIVRAIREHQLPVQTVMGISTDKACKPVNVMGMTKAIQERVFITGNLHCPHTRFLCVRYGNVLASRGSVIPLFVEQVRAGGPLTVTTADMTRFLLSLNEAVDIIFAGLRTGLAGETYIPRVPSAKVTDIAAVMIGDRRIEVQITGIRPGEKVHEILVSEEEAHRTTARNGYYVIQPILPELRRGPAEKPVLTSEFSSADHVLDRAGLTALLRRHALLDTDTLPIEGELLR